MHTEYLEKELQNLSITYNEKQIRQLIDYYEMLIERNKVMNLTAITEWDEVVRKHFIDSLSIVKAKDITEVASMIDVGTGAGFPGIPLKIMFPHLHVVLMDSLNKRIVFLKAVGEALGLENIDVIHSRAEDLAKNPVYREQFDLCVTRAVSSLNTIAEYCLPFVKQGGYFIPYKSGKLEEELVAAKQALFLLKGKVKDTLQFHLADTDMDRSFVVIEKMGVSPKKYPRKAGMPSKFPL